MRSFEEKQQILNNNTTLDSTEVVFMEFKKVTISLPKNLYDEGMSMINKGLFSNFSDLVRSGIRSEFKELQPVIRGFDESNIYRDKQLIAGVRQSRKEAKAGKGKILRSDKEIKGYLEAL
jgi:hypothetical protein